MPFAKKSGQVQVFYFIWCNRCMLHGIQGPAALWVPSVPMMINRKHTEAAREDASNETAETLRIGKQRQMHSVLWRRRSAAPLFFSASLQDDQMDGLACSGLVSHGTAVRRSISGKSLSYLARVLAPIQTGGRFRRKAR